MLDVLVEFDSITPKFFRPCGFTSSPFHFTFSISILRIDTESKVGESYQVPKDDPRFRLSGHPLIRTRSLLPVVGVVNVFGVRRPQIFIPAMRVDSD
jgi:hypothetical protein